MSKADYLMAASPRTHANDLVVLSQSDSAAVRAQVAENPNCPLFLLAFLVQDTNAEVRMGVAANPRVTMNILEWLAQDSCPDVRFALAEDHCMPEEILAALIEDDNPYVAERAKTTMARIHQPRIIGCVHHLPTECDLKAC